MWQALYESAEVEWLRRDAERRLAQLRALDDLDALQAIVDRAAAAGSRPRSWQDLVRAGLLKRIPVDPAGKPYELDAAGRVHLAPGSGLLPLPTEPKRIMPVTS
jgi:DNA mismatch repair protein MutH